MKKNEIDKFCLELNEKEIEVLYEAIQRANARKLDAVAQIETDDSTYELLQNEIKVLDEILTRL